MSRRPPDVICGAAIFDSRWRRWKWRHPEPGAGFSTPSEVEVENGCPSASGRHLEWPHFGNRKWGHPRWRPEAEGPPFSTSTSLGIEKPALYYWGDSDNIDGWPMAIDYLQLRRGLMLLYSSWRRFPVMVLENEIEVSMLSFFYI